MKESTIPNAGRGLFAGVLIPAGERIGQYTGEVISRKEAILRTQPGPDQNNYLIKLSHHKFLDGSTLDNEMRWANAKPEEQANARGIGVAVGKKQPMQVFLEAKVDIPPGQEVFWDYGNEFEL